MGGDWMHIWNQLTLTSEQEDGFTTRWLVIPPFAFASEKVDAVRGVTYTRTELPDKDIKYIWWD
jgi:hypothetical protein